jgi:hypothetical protein
MSEKLLTDIADELSSIYANIPNETSLHDVESKLDRLIDLMEYQNDASDRILNRLDTIVDYMPDSISLTATNDRLDRMNNTLDSMESNLGHIESNTSNY